MGFAPPKRDVLALQVREADLEAAYEEAVQRPLSRVPAGGSAALRRGRALVQLAAEVRAGDSSDPDPLAVRATAVEVAERLGWQIKLPAASDDDRAAWKGDLEVPVGAGALQTQADRLADHVVGRLEDAVAQRQTRDQPDHGRSVGGER